ncbi:hypothetical protein PMAL9190_01536 [Photobacterium malacitanum]|uniref:Uncharacterized protein n=1 Tax=Photobacterium malacitanum TaxID=2204294 RepID=A0A1Y6MC58_9GAMM|nr:TnsD family Tn7-like transposition protein [Photobacterium malacitanum]SMY34177.1 hypothetical protein PMAL9190_01536 [Photobacterium malacitanum]
MVLPYPYPDELLLSRLIRYLRLSGEQPSSFCLRTFNSRRVSLHPFLTGGISPIASMTNEDPDTILHTQTLAPLFLFFLPKYRNKILTSLLSNKGLNIYKDKPLPPFSRKGSRILKWCPICAKENIYNFGMSYWHRTHQTPGLTSCHKHNVKLFFIELFARKQLMGKLLPTPNNEITYSSTLEFEVSFFCHELLNNLNSKELNINPVQLYNSRLDELGFVTKNGHLRTNKMMSEFTSSLKNLPDMLELSVYKKSCDYYQCTSKLLSENCHHHPLRYLLQSNNVFQHLLFSKWLFKDAKIMLEYNAPPKKKLTNDQTKSINKKVERQCLILLQNGSSLSEVNRQTGKSKNYLKNLALKNGITIMSKPHIINKELHQRIVKLAKLNIHRRRISELCGISIGAVEQIISSKKGLVSWRKKCRFESRQRRHRVCIIRYRQKYPLAIRKEIKKNCYASFMWLYKHTNEWLERNLPPATKVKKNNRNKA